MSTPEKMTNCPSEETLAAFIDRRLDSEARRRVIEHMSVCADCYSVISAGWDFQAAEPTAAAPVARPRFGSRTVWASALAACVAAVLFLPPIRNWIGLKRSGGLSEVVSAYEGMSQRHVESRPSGGFPHKELKGTMRNAQTHAHSDPEFWPLLKTATRLEADGGKLSWRELRASAIARLMLGDSDRAVQLIERALASRGAGDPTLLNDRAAVYVERARRSRTAEDVARAVSMAERAWQLSKTPESAWNRALAYEYGERTADALGAWRDYLTLDASSSWSVEAAQKIRNLQRGSKLRSMQ